MCVCVCVRFRGFSYLLLLLLLLLIIIYNVINPANIILLLQPQHCGIFTRILAFLHVNQLGPAADPTRSWAQLIYM